jgi:hypothetical protein
MEEKDFFTLFNPRFVVARVVRTEFYVDKQTQNLARVRVFLLLKKTITYAQKPKVTVREFPSRTNVTGQAHETTEGVRCGVYTDQVGV